MTQTEDLPSPSPPAAESPPPDRAFARDDRVDVDAAELEEYQRKWAGRLKSEMDRQGDYRPASDGRDRGVRYNVKHDMRDLVNRRGREPGDSGGSFADNGGLPPADSSYRCVGTRADGARCRHWACRGDTRCCGHGGVKRTDRVVVPRLSLPEMLPGVPEVYAKLLSSTLAEKLREAQEGPLDDLREELGLCKVFAGQMVQLWSDAQGCESVSAQEKLALGMAMREAVTHCVDVAEKIARIQGKAGPIDPNALNIVLQQFVTVAYDVLGDEGSEAVREISQRVQSIRLPRAGVEEGTLLTPDLDVREMDATVPRTVPMDASTLEHKAG